MNHESASYKRYKEELSEKTYVDFVMADGEVNSIFSTNYQNTASCKWFAENYEKLLQVELPDNYSITEVVKYIEFDQMSKLLSNYDIHNSLRDLAVRYLAISMNVNTNVSEDDINRVTNILLNFKLLIDVEQILDFDSKYLPVDYRVRFNTIKQLKKSLSKAGIGNSIADEIIRKEYENRILTDMILWFRESGLKVQQFYGISYFTFKGLLFTYKFADKVDIEEVKRFIDSFHYMQGAPAKYVLCLYNGASIEDIVYNDITIAVRNLNECMDKYLIKGLSFTKAFKSRLGN